MGRYGTTHADALNGLARVHLGFFPTPLQLMPRLGAALGHDSLYIKRDDLTGLSLGGNKTRSLEYLLGDAISRGADTVLTAGGLQSNLCSLTAVACAKLGLRCILVHNDLHPRSPMDGNMLVSYLVGAEPVFIGRVSEDERARAMDGIAAALVSKGSRPYVIHNGASTPMGATGYLNAAIELSDQTKAQGIELRHAIIVGAMGGTASGFAYGASLLERPFHVHVVSVEYPEDELSGRMNGLFCGLRQLTGIESLHNPWEVTTIHDGYMGEGYGLPTLQSRSAQEALALTEGIFLEAVYMSKTMAGLIGLVQSGVIPRGESACIIHTGGMAALFAQSTDAR